MLPSSMAYAASQHAAVGQYLLHLTLSKGCQKPIEYGTYPEAWRTPGIIHGETELYMPPRLYTTTLKFSGLSAPSQVDISIAVLAEVDPAPFCKVET